MSEQEPVNPIEFSPIPSGPEPGPLADLAVVAGVHLDITVVLGRTRMTVAELLQQREGSVLDLGPIGRPVEILANNHLLARGEIVAVGDMLGVRITEMQSPS